MGAGADKGGRRGQRKGPHEKGNIVMAQGGNLGQPDRTGGFPRGSLGAGGTRPHIQIPHSGPQTTALLCWGQLRAQRGGWGSASSVPEVFWAPGEWQAGGTRETALPVPCGAALAPASGLRAAGEVVSSQPGLGAGMALRLVSCENLGFPGQGAVGVPATDVPPGGLCEPERREGPQT